MGQNEKELLLAKLADAGKRSQKRPCFLGFLNENESAFAWDFLKRAAAAGTPMFWGGYEEAERKLLGLFPDYLEPDQNLFPLMPLTFFYRKEDALTHRDFLGALMSLGVERSVVGDILPESGRCVVFVRSELADYFCLNLRKIGNVGVRVQEGAEMPLPLGHEFQEISGVVASQRLDCIVALLCKTSREKASGLILSGMVALNHLEVLSVSMKTSEGDQISVRGKGRFVIDRLGPLTGKGRLSVQCRKYR